MRVGVVREVKPDEHRVPLAPGGARELVADGHEVWVECGAGCGSSFGDDEYRGAGAHIASAEEIWSTADLILKVKEPLPQEYGFLREELCFLHLSADEMLTRALIETGSTAVAYETVQTSDGGLPLLAPMSEVAGRLATQAGAHFLEKPNGGRGLLLGGVPSVSSARALVLGAGTVGYNAATSLGLGARVEVLDCFETSRPTTHSDPVYQVTGVTHYYVSNIPDAVPITSTKALTNATLPHVRAIAAHGVRKAARLDFSLAQGINILEHRVTHSAVAEAHGLAYTLLEQVLSHDRSTRAQ